jgi:hypothetical protein
MYIYSRGLFDPLTIPKKPKRSRGREIVIHSCQKALGLGGKSEAIVCEGCEIEKHRMSESTNINKTGEDTKEHDIENTRNSMMSEKRNTIPGTDKRLGQEEIDSENEYLKPPMPSNEDERRRAL